jgi:DNA-binding NarL/FixJ family response regulator
MKTLLIIDDHDIVRSGLPSLLGKSWQILGTAASLDEAKKLFKSLDNAPDLILLDLQLGNEWGLDIIGDKSFGRGKFPLYLFFLFMMTLPI